MPNGGVTSSDVSPYKDAESALRESEQAIRIYTDNVPAMIAYIDRDYRIQFVNKAFERTMRVWREQVIGRPNQEIFTKEEYEARLPYLERALEGRRQRFEVSIDRAGSIENLKRFMYLTGPTVVIYRVFSCLPRRDRLKRSKT